MEWKNAVFDEQPVFDPAVFAAYETTIGVKFPGAYRETIALHQGQQPVEDLFDYEDASGPNTTVMGILFHFVENDPDYNILENFREAEEALPPLVIPFSEDPGGFLIAFDFRDKKEQPGIVLLDNDTADGSGQLIKVADDFETFIGSLYEEK